METLRYEPDKGLGNIDRILLRGAAAHKSWNEISKLTNGVLKPAECAVRVTDILDERDPLSEAQKKLLLIDDMMQVKDHLMAKALDFNNMDAVKPLISILTQLDKTMAAEKFDMGKAMSEISRAHAGLMLQGISITLERSFLELEKRYPEVKKSELTEIFQVAMPDAIREIESRIPGE
jgi:hypothetical protein